MRLNRWFIPLISLMFCLSAVPVSGLEQWPVNASGFPDVSGDWIDGSNLVRISQTGGSLVATCTYGNISWRMDGTITRDGVVTGRLVHTAGVPQSATGFAQDRRLVLSADARVLQGQATFVGGSHAVNWRRSSPLPTSTSGTSQSTNSWVTNSSGYPDISGDWIDGSNLVRISQTGGSLVATCTYGNISWRMDGTITRDGVVTGRLVHTAGVPQSATGFAQDRRLVLSADARVLQGQATFVGGSHAVNWKRTASSPPPPPPPNDTWYSAKRLTWVTAVNSGGASALIDGVSEKYLFGTQYYNPIKPRSNDGTTNILELMQSAILGKKTINVEVDKEGWILSAVLNCDPAVPMPPMTRVDTSSIRMPGTSKFDGTVKSAYGTSESQSIWIYVDGRSAPPDQNTDSPRSQALKGWVKLVGESPAAASNMFALSCHAAALGHPVRIYTNERGGIGNIYLWSK